MALIVLALIGDLGSGKTTFAQAFAEALGVKEKIKSPTFIIFRKHEIHQRAFRFFIILMSTEFTAKKKF